MQWTGARTMMRFLAGGLFLAAAALAPPEAPAQTGADPHEWRFYGGDPGHTKYTPLDRITADNVDQLRIAWTWTSVDEKLRAENPVIRDGQRFRTYAYEVTPLVVDGVLYSRSSSWSRATRRIRISTIRPQVSNLPGPRGLPLFKPPYSQLAALDMNAGEKLWSVPLGDGPRDHEALRGMDLPPLGNYEKGGGPLLTKTLLFIGQGIESNRLRAFDKDTGYELFDMELPARSSSAPILAELPSSSWRSQSSHERLARQLCGILTIVLKSGGSGGVRNATCE